MIKCCVNNTLVMFYCSKTDVMLNSKNEQTAKCFNVTIIPDSLIMIKCWKTVAVNQIYVQCMEQTSLATCTCAMFSVRELIQRLSLQSVDVKHMQGIWWLHKFPLVFP